MSSANRDRRRKNREARLTAVEEALRRSRRQRFTLVTIGVILAVAVGVVLVARAAGKSTPAASKTTTPSDTSSTSSTSTTFPGSVATKPCVAETKPFPTGAPFVPVTVGPPPKTLVKHDYKIGTGAAVTAKSTVTVDYVGVACSTGKSFTSTYSPHKSTVGPISHFIQGWQQGIPGMKVGGIRVLGIPPALAYGTSPPPGSPIKPDETLWFVVQLVSTK